MKPVVLSSCLVKQLLQSAFPSARQFALEENYPQSEYVSSRLEPSFFVKIKSPIDHRSAAACRIDRFDDGRLSHSLDTKSNAL